MVKRRKIQRKKIKVIGPCYNVGKASGNESRCIASKRGQRPSKWLTPSAANPSELQATLERLQAKQRPAGFITCE